MAISNVARQWSRDAQRVELWVKVPVREVVEADGPRWITGVVLHQHRYVHISCLLESLGSRFMFFFMGALGELLIVVCKSTEREKFVDELLAGVVVRHHDAALVQLRLQLVNDLDAVASPARLELLKRYARSKRIKEHFRLKVLFDELLHHDEHFIKSLHLQALVVYLLDGGEHGSED